MAAAFPADTVRACVFDAYGTLFDTRAAAERCRDRLGDRADTLTRIWRTKQLEYSWLRSLRGDFVDFWHVTGESLDYAMKMVGVADPALRSRLLESYFILDAFPDAAPTVQRIRAAEIKTAILSNGATTMLTAAVGHAGLQAAFDAVLSVDEVRVYKPHPHVYQMACDRLGVPAEGVCFVSANAWDASGAAHFGFRVAWLNRAGGIFDTLPGTPAAEIGALTALPALLGL
jgi:2-haloacid dehalogenase